MFKILLVEDDRELNKTVCAYLEQNQEIPILFIVNALLGCHDLALSC